MHYAIIKFGYTEHLFFQVCGLNNHSPYEKVFWFRFTLIDPFTWRKASPN